MREIKYDIYGSFLDGGGEYKVPKSRVKKMFTDAELKRIIDGEEITEDIMKFWAEEAMNSKSGISISIK